MIKISICDDDICQQKRICSLLQQYEEAHPGLAARVSVFSSGPELLNQAEEENGFDLYILDVIMPKMNGIELGLKLRSINSDGVIIYLTTSRDYAVESYLVQAFYYLLKPVDKTAFYTVLDKAVSMLEKQSMASIEVRTANGIRRLSFDEIMYVELAKRFAKYHLTDEKVINSITLRNSFHTEVASLLKDERFTLCGTSFAVNLHHVIAVEKTDLILKGEHRVPLSRSKYIPVKKQWADYWLRRSSV